MTRFALLAGALVFCPAWVRADDDPGLKTTIAYVQKLQTTGGGFFAMTPKPNVKIVPTLKATSAAVRALHYLGAKVPNAQAVANFVASCHDPESGGFADLPKGKTDVFTTAVGIMAVTELKMPEEKYVPGVVKYLSEYAKSFEDIRIAAAGLERFKGKSAKNKEWLEAVLKLQNADGTFGTGPGQARATGGSVVTLLRLGGAVKNKDAVLKVLKDGQRNNGAYGKGDDELASDLETTYRVMRCFMMLKDRPASIEGLRSFVAKCRNEDGGYGLSPGQPSNISGTYFAAIIRHWLDSK